MRISFYCAADGYARFSFDGSSLADGVGGSESALINLGEALAEVGHAITVFGNVQAARTIGDVLYRPVDEVAGHECDTLVLFRFFARLPDDVSCRLRLLWSHDLPLRDPPYRVHESLAVVDGLVAVSRYHAGLLRAFAEREGFGHLGDRILVGGNGVRTELYRDGPAKQPARFIYCSVPDRGADELVHIWPRIRRELPDATLVVTGGWELRNLPAAKNAPLASLDGVLHRGVIPRSELVAEQLRAEAHLHPCGFPELFCLASMECQAAGAPSVVSNVAALPETVRGGNTGVVVDGRPGTEQFRDAFAVAAVRLVNTRGTLAETAALAREHAGRFDYRLVADRWANQLDRWLED